MINFFFLLSDLTLLFGQPHKIQKLLDPHQILLMTRFVLPLQTNYYIFTADFCDLFPLSATEIDIFFLHFFNDLLMSFVHHFSFILFTFCLYLSYFCRFISFNLSIVIVIYCFILFDNGLTILALKFFWMNVLNEMQLIVYCFTLFDYLIYRLILLVKRLATIMAFLFPNLQLGLCTYHQPKIPLFLKFQLILHLLVILYLNLHGQLFTQIIRLQSALKFSNFFKF